MRRRRRTKLQTGKTLRWRSRKYFRKCVMKKKVRFQRARWNKIRGGWEVLTGAGRSCVLDPLLFIATRAKPDTHRWCDEFLPSFLGPLFSGLYFSRDAYLPGSHILAFNCVTRLTRENAKGTWKSSWRIRTQARIITNNDGPPCAA